MTPYRSCVEVIVSDHPGVGKSLVIQRYTEALSARLPTDHLDRTQVCVTIPLFHGVVDKDSVVKALLPCQDADRGSTPKIYHLDVSPLVSKLNLKKK